MDRIGSSLEMGFIMVTGVRKACCFCGKPRDWAFVVSCGNWAASVPCYEACHAKIELVWKNILDSFKEAWGKLSGETPAYFKGMNWLRDVSALAGLSYPNLERVVVHLPKEERWEGEQ